MRGRSRKRGLSFIYNCPSDGAINTPKVLGIGLFKQIDIELMVYLGVRGQYVGGIAKPTSLP